MAIISIRVWDVLLLLGYIGRPPCNGELKHFTAGDSNWSWFVISRARCSDSSFWPGHLQTQSLFPSEDEFAVFGPLADTLCMGPFYSRRTRYFNRRCPKSQKSQADGSIFSIPDRVAIPDVAGSLSIEFGLQAPGIAEEELRNV